MVQWHAQAYLMRADHEVGGQVVAWEALIDFITSQNLMLQIVLLS